ncbi:MAG: hypothetical protein OXK80_03720 [Bdellovibrionales bacterium]|nr:hypothetical protein [Bdellovibrionales bacterium]
MANRNKDFNTLVADKFKNRKFAQAYIINLINKEGMSLEEALRETIISMGLQVFADKAGLSIQYVSDFVNKRRKFTTGAIDKYLNKVFQLQIKISVESIRSEVA